MPPVHIVKLAADLQRGDFVVNLASPSFFANILNAQGRFSPVIDTPMKRLDESLGNDYDADSGVTHEFGHQWVQHVKGGVISSGQPHWPLSTMATGIWAGAHPQKRRAPLPLPVQPQKKRGLDRGGHRGSADFQRFRSLPERPDLGIGRESADSYYEPSKDLRRADGRLRRSRYARSGQFTTATTQDLIQAAGGPRVPSSATSQKNFRVATGGRAQITAKLTTDLLLEINYAGVVNSASFDKAAFGPATVASLFGSSLATAGAATVPLPTSLGGVRVIVDGKPAPLF